MNRLAEDTVTQGSSQVNEFEYFYDKAGNRNKQTINGTTTNYNYNAANELTSTSAGVSYSYDANGKLTNISAGNENFTYNAKNQTTSINGISMTYSGADQNQQVRADGTSYVNTPFGISSQTSSSGTTYYTHDNRGNLVDERTPSGTFSYLFDGLGSIVGLSNSSGNLVGTERYQYDPFGNLLTTPVSPTQQSTIWRYASSQFDSGTKLTKFGIRYDDPSVGRWTQQDPIGGSLFDPRSSNRYVYAKCDPVNVVDPGGKFNLTPGCILAIIAGIGGIIGALQSAGAEIQGVNGLGLFLGIFSPPLGLIVIIIGNLIALVYASAVIAGIYSGVAAACGCLESHKPHF